MRYRTKRPRTRHVLVFGVGATLAIAQLGAGCVPAPEAPRCDPDAAADNPNDCRPARSTPSGQPR